MKRIVIAMAAVSAGTAVAADRPVKLDAGAAYVLVDIGTLDDAALKGTSAPGTLTLAPYDGTAKAVPAGARRVMLSAKPIAKGEDVRQYVAPVMPGTWVIEGASGTAFSLGSRTFEVAPRQVVDLGVVKPVVDRVEGEAPKSMAKAVLGAALFGSMKPKNIRPVRLDWHMRGAADLPVPASLAGRAVVAAEYRDGATFGNDLGGLVNRIGGRGARPAD